MLIRIHYILSILTSVLIAISLGCHDTHRPSDLPALYPCKIMIQQEGKPYEGASVVLLAKELQGQRMWIVSGKTGTDGWAKMVTQPDFSGVPEGEYKVLVGKNVADLTKVPPQDVKSEEYQKWQERSNGYIPLYSVINPDFDIKDKTPFEIKIPKSSKETTATFDVGKPVRILINPQ